MIYYIHKDCITKSVKNLSGEEIDNYLNNGWLIGKCPSHWYNNGDISILLKEGEPIPQGFNKGQSDKQKKASGAGVRRYWDSSTEEHRQKLSKSVSNGLIKMWEKLSDEEKQKREESRLITRDNWSQDYKNELHIKLSQSAKLNRATITDEEYNRRAQLCFNTRKKNKTTNTSSYEENFYIFLKSIFNNNDIIREYYDKERYPFHCDFYIKSLDLFIELNFHWTHDNHPFDKNDENDLAILNKIRSKQHYLNNGNKNSYFVKENVWTKRDVEKLQYAAINNLNYIIIYTQDQLDIIKYMLQGVL